MAIQSATITVSVPPDVCFAHMHRSDDRLDHISNQLFGEATRPTITSDAASMTVCISSRAEPWLRLLPLPQISVEASFSHHPDGTRARITVSNDCDWYESVTIFPIKWLSKQVLLGVASELLALEAGYLGHLAGEGQNCSAESAAV